MERFSHKKDKMKLIMSEGRRIIIFYIMGISVNVDNVMKIIVISVKFY